jgi:hypothetical protein
VEAFKKSRLKTNLSIIGSRFSSWDALQEEDVALMPTFAGSFSAAPKCVLIHTKKNLIKDNITHFLTQGS